MPDDEKIKPIGRWVRDEVIGGSPSQEHREKNFSFSDENYEFNSDNIFGTFSDDKPISEIEPRYRLGTLIRRFRVATRKSLRELASFLDITPTMLGEVERGLSVMSAPKLQELASFLKVRYDPFLDAARDWHDAIWKEGDNGNGVTLSDMKTKTRSLYSDSVAESELELELIRTADELVFLANVARETSIKAEQAAIRARELLERRGLQIPEQEPLDGPEEVECAGPSHKRLPVKLRVGKDFVLAFKTESGSTLYFCSKRCGDEWRRENGEK